jgi:hypothetical protein
MSDDQQPPAARNRPGRPSSERSRGPGALFDAAAERAVARRLRRKPEAAPPPPDVLRLFERQRKSLYAQYPGATPSDEGRASLDRLAQAQNDYVIRRAGLDIAERRLTLRLRALGGASAAATLVFTMGRVAGLW